MPAIPAMPDTNDPTALLQSQVLRQFRVVFNAVRTHFQQMERQVGLGGALVWALHIIGEHEGIGVNALAQHMDVHQSTASNLLRTLTQRGLVQAGKDPQDRRSSRLRLTPAGQELLLKVPGPFSGVLPAALAQLPQNTLVQLNADLASVIAVLGADESAGTIPLANL